MGVLAFPFRLWNCVEDLDIVDDSPRLKINGNGKQLQLPSVQLLRCAHALLLRLRLAFPDRRFRFLCDLLLPKSGSPQTTGEDHPSS